MDYRCKPIVVKANPNYHNLPTGYTEVEYLQSSGTQYINTTWTPDLTKDFTITGKAGFVSSTRGMLISAFGYSSGLQYNLSIELYDGTKLRLYVGGINVALIGTGLELNEISDFSISYSSNTFTMSGTMNEISGSGTVNSSGRIVNTTTAVLGSDTHHRYPYGMYGNIHIINGDEEYNFIPCYRISDSVAGMYDIVNDVFYTNSGTGTFTVGPEIPRYVGVPCKAMVVKYSNRLPSAYKEVEYLESSGQQYIDTGVVGVQDYKYEVSFAVISQQNYGYIFGDQSNFSRLLGLRLYANNLQLQELNGSSMTQAETITLDTKYTKSYTSTTNGDKSLYLFAGNQEYVPSYYGYDKIYYFKVYDTDDEIVANLVPCVRISDQKPGMYDLVNDTFYTNANTSATSDFSVGEYTLQSYLTKPVVVHYNTALCLTANTAGSTVELIAVGSPSISDTAYSLDGQTWTTFTPSTTSGTNTITLTNVGDKVYFRNNVIGGFTGSVHLQFVMSGSISASGNCNSMYTTTGFNNLTTLSQNYCFGYLFDGCTALTTAPKLPATTLSWGCYNGMFQGCTSLITAPTLPAMTMKTYCYRLMFYGCTSLTTAPSLPATSMASTCYGSMFQNCTSLVYVPNLPATALVSGCYGSMFQGCSALQVSDTQTSSATHSWALPTSDTFTATSTQSNIFTGCAGTRSSNHLSPTVGSSVTYYTQNEPV